MPLPERFMGEADPEVPFGEMVANPALRRAPSFQLLGLKPLDLDADALNLAIRAIHPSLARTRVEFLGVKLEGVSAEESESIIGLAGWGNHVVKIVGFNHRIPQNVFDTCVLPAYYSEELKEQAKLHKSHVLITYAGYETDPLEQYVALTIVASALAKFDGIVLLNDAARCSIPVAALLAQEPGVDSLDMFRSLPIPMLFGGFSKIEIEDIPGVWIRTFGNILLQLPDLAFHAEGHEQGQETFDLIDTMLAYMRETGKRLAAGDTMHIENDIYMRVRSRTPEEWYLDSDGEMLVVEKTSP